MAPETPGSIHEGGELGYALSHAYGAAFDNPDLVVAAIVGDGEAETGPLATSWHSNKFVDPRRDGAVLPILHLNGYKIANPTVLARIPEDELLALMRGYGHTPYVVEGSDPDTMHQAFAATLDRCLDEIAQIQREARTSNKPVDRRPWPMIVLRSPKGWTGPEEVDGKPIEGNWRSHQVPFADARKDDGHRKVLEDWLRSYKPEELFDEAGALVPEIAGLNPGGERRMSANLHANGGKLLVDLRMPDFVDYAVPVEAPGTGAVESTRVLGTFLRDVMRRNMTTSASSHPTRTPRTGCRTRWRSPTAPGTPRSSPTTTIWPRTAGSWRSCPSTPVKGWLEGYLLTGRHGLFSCYEAFIHVIDSMFNQHAKWLKSTDEIPWRRPIASLNYLLTSHVWRQDHNGFSHQDPGFIDHVMNKKAEVVRVYLPPDANTLLSVADHCLRSKQYVNVIVAGKQPALQYLSIDDAVIHCTKGIGIWDWASNDEDGEPDVVDGLCRRRADDGGAGGGRHPARGLPRPQGPVRQRGRPDASAAPRGAPARPARRRLRLAVHHRQAGDLRLPRLPVADPPADVPAYEPPQHPRPRLQGGGHHHHALRHDRAQPGRPVQPGHGRDRPGAATASRWPDTPASG